MDRAAESLRDATDVVVRTHPTQRWLEMLVLMDAFNVGTGHVARASAMRAEHDGRPAVTIDFNSRGAEAVSDLVSEQVVAQQRRLAVIVDDRLYTAPVLRARFADAAQITGMSSDEEAVDIATVLNAGPLPAILHQRERRNVD